MATTPTGPNVRGAWTAFGLTAAIYLFVYFHRMSMGVVVPELAATFKAGALPVGVMSSVYFYTYAVAQFTSGALCDVVGARVVVLASTFILAVASVVFAVAPNFGWAVAARGLIGLGAAGVWIPSMKMVSDNFPVSSFATLSGLLGSAGNVGAIVAAAPFAWLVLTVGWRGSFWVIGALTLVLFAVAQSLLIDASRSGGYTSGTDAARGSERTGTERSGATPFLQLFAGMQGLLHTPQFWLLNGYQNLIHAPMIAVQGLWGCPFLMSVYGYGKVEAARIITLIAVGYIAGGPLGGYLSDKVFGSRKKVVICASLLHALTWILLAQSANRLRTLGLCIVFFAMGLTYGGTLVAIAMTRESFGPGVFGTAVGMGSIALQVGTGAFQVLMGYVLDLSKRSGFADPAIGYRSAFLMCFVLVVLSLVPMALAKDTRGQDP